MLQLTRAQRERRSRLNGRAQRWLEKEVRVRKGIVAVGIVAHLLVGSAARAAEPSEFRPFAFLVGEWTASGEGRPGSGAGTAVFSLSLQDRVIVRTSYAEYPATGGKPASRHDDLMVIYASPAGVRADYYDSEGHVIRYNVRSPTPGQAVFLSEPAAGEPTYRLTYKLASNDALDGEFEIAAPGTEIFKSYLSWHSSRVTKAAK